MRIKLTSFICTCVLALSSLSANAQVTVDAAFDFDDFVGATYNVPRGSTIPIISISITAGGAINGFPIGGNPANTTAKFGNGSFNMSGGTVTMTGNFLQHVNYTNITISGGTINTGGNIFSNMVAGGSLDISGGNFSSSTTLSGYAGDVTISGGVSSIAVPNPGVNSTLTFIGSNWTFGGNPLVFSGDEADLTEIGFGTLQGTLADGTAFQVVLGGGGFGTFPDSPVVTVIDVDLAVQPEIDVVPLASDFGNVEIGSVTTLVATVSNEGTGDLTVSVIELQPGGSDDYSITMAPALPAEISPGARFRS